MNENHTERDLDGEAVIERCYNKRCRDIISGEAQRIESINTLRRHGSFVLVGIIEESCPDSGKPLPSVTTIESQWNTQSEASDALRRVSNRNDWGSFTEFKTLKPIDNRR